MTKFLRRLMLVVLVVVPPIALGACAKPQAAESIGGVVPEQLEPGAEPQSVASPPVQLEPPPPTFAFSADLAGRAVARVVTPNTVQPLPSVPLVVEPVTRPLPRRVREPESLVRGVYARPLVTIPPPLPALVPVPPPERVPFDLGVGANGVPARPVLSVAAVETPRAPDVNQPPPAPVLGRPVPDRIGFDDPTSELSNKVIVGSRVSVKLAPAGFLKVVVPDPFEFGAQVKPTVPATAEPSAAPIPVNPRRVK